MLGRLVIPLPPFGPNNQLQTVVEVASLAKSVNAALVLPDVVPWYADNHSTSLPFGSAYDVSRLPVPTMTHAQWRSVDVSHAHQVLLALNGALNKAEQHHHFGASLRLPTHVRSTSVHSRDVKTLKGVYDLVQAALTQTQTSRQPPLHIFVSCFTCFPALPFDAAAALWRQLDFAPRILKLAARVAQALFGSAPAALGNLTASSPPFVAVHVRRADALDGSHRCTHGPHRSVSCPGEIDSHELAKMIIAKAPAGANVYAAMVDPPQMSMYKHEPQILSHEVPRLRSASQLDAMRAAAAEPALSALEVSLIEQALCVHADLFLASITPDASSSTWSLNAMRMRRARGRRTDYLYS